MFYLSDLSCAKGMSAWLDDREPFAIRRHRESVVEGDEGQRRGLAISGDQRRGQLQRVDRSELVHAQQSDRDLANRCDGLDFVPGGGEFGESTPRNSPLRRVGVLCGAAAARTDRRASPPRSSATASCAPLIRRLARL